MKCSRFAFARSNFFILPRLQSFVKNFFQSFLIFDFLCGRRLFDSFSILTHPKPFVKKFFLVFSIFSCGRVALADSLRILPHGFLFVKHFSTKTSKLFCWFLPADRCPHLVYFSSKMQTGSARWQCVTDCAG